MRDDGCRCGEVKVGGRPTGSLNWSPDCPVHPWDERLQAQADRAVEMQRLARIARRRAAREAKTRVVFRMPSRRSAFVVARDLAERHGRGYYVAWIDPASDPESDQVFPFAVVTYG